MGVKHNHTYNRLIHSDAGNRRSDRMRWWAAPRRQPYRWRLYTDSGRTKAFWCHESDQLNLIGVESSEQGAHGLGTFEEWWHLSGVFIGLHGPPVIHLSIDSLRKSTSAQPWLALLHWVGKNPPGYLSLRRNQVEGGGKTMWINQSLVRNPNGWKESPEGQSWRGSLRHGLNFAGIGQSVTFSRPTNLSLFLSSLPLLCVLLTHSLTQLPSREKKPFTALVRIVCHFY